jgi:hypothetical protein
LSPAILYGPELKPVVPFWGLAPFALLNLEKYLTIWFDTFVHRSKKIILLWTKFCIVLFDQLYLT